MGIFSRLFKRKETKPIVEERNFFNIKINDIITYDLEDYQVVGKLDYNNHGYKWYAYQLQGDHKTIWLSVEMDDELELGIYEATKLKLTEPIPKELEVEGVTYYLDEQGTARVQGEGRGQNVNGQEVRYYDFCDEEEEQFLSVEIWGSEIEVSKGYEIDGYEIKIIAGSQ
jgi:hypothetical protein